ncbi:MAG: ABC transporter ATP-binding protein [Lachnospiraceae bacterium]
MSTILEVRDLKFKYFEHAKASTIEHLNLSFEEESCSIIIGSSGCGKSTLAMLLSGVYPENAGYILQGDILLNGTSLRNFDIPTRSKYIGVLFQNPDLQFCMNTLYKEMIFCMENLSIDPFLMDQKINEFATKYGVFDMLTRELHTLSGGEKQRAALCCLMLMQPSILVLDEPFANLDATSTKQLLELLFLFKYEHNTTIIAIDHKLDAWLPYVDEIIVLGANCKMLQKNIIPSTLTIHRALFEQEGLFFPSKSKAFLPKITNNLEVLKLENVCLGYKKKEIIHNASLSCTKGTITAILGSSGSGKSTLFSAILGQHPFSGTIKIKNKLLDRHFKHIELYSIISAVFQNPGNQFISINVLDEVCLSLEQWRGKGNHTQLALDLLYEYGLKKYQKYSPYMLSQGQQRRLAVLSVLAGNQSLLLLDEPTYGQDQKNTVAIFERLKNLCESGLTVLFSTHDEQIAKEYSDAIYYLDKGVLKQWQT